MSNKEDDDAASLHQSERTKSAHTEAGDNKSINDQDGELESAEAEINGEANYLQ